MDFDNPPDRLFGSDVAIWLERMGFNGKQVSLAAERLGMSARQLTRKRDGEGGAELSVTDRLAMAALRAGLPPWTPDADAYLMHISELQKVIDETPERPAA